MKKISYKELTSDVKINIINWYKTHNAVSTYTKFNISDQTLNTVLKEFKIDKHDLATSVKMGCLEKYGVENVSQSAAYRKTISTRSKEQVKASSEKRKRTNKERYGVEHVLQDKDIRQRAEETCLERYGVTNFALSDDLQNRVIAKNRATYGVDYPMQLDCFKEQYKETCFKKYGVSNYALTDQFKGSQKEAALDKFENEQFKELFYNRDKSITFLTENVMSVYELHTYFNVTVPTIESWLVRLNLKDYVKHVRSHYENDLIEMFPNFKRNNRVALNNGQELDLYDPTLKLAIEFNGVYWHSDACVPTDYHINKSLAAEKQGIRLIHIYEYEWLDERKRPIIESLINIAIHNIPQKIYARQCSIRQITNKEAKPFNDKNHLQGHRNAQVTYGLFYNNELVQLMSFSKTKYNKNLKTDTEWEIIRGCPGSNNIVVGGVGKLFKHFIKEHNPTKIFSYCDFNKFDGKSYEAIGMQFTGYTGPDKTWIIGDKCVPRNPSKYTELKEKATGIIWGAGSKKYEWKKDRTEEFDA